MNALHSYHFLCIYIQMHAIDSEAALPDSGFIPYMGNRVGH